MGLPTQTGRRIQATPRPSPMTTLALENLEMTYGNGVRAVAGLDLTVMIIPTAISF